MNREETDPFLAKPADFCCLKGTIHSGEAQGTIETIDGIPTYIATPDAATANGNILLYFPDAFGLQGNAFLLMDAFAACGYLTLGVDYFLGDGVGKHSDSPLSDPNFDFEVWKTKHLTASEVVAAKWIEGVQAKYGKHDDVKYAAVGYCWGARFVCAQLSKTGLCRVGAIAHPSFMKESHVTGLNAPIFFAAPNTDALFPAEQRSRAVEIMTEDKKSFNMRIFQNVDHGFATRPQLSIPYEKWAKEQCFKNFVDWFEFWLSID
ncbi:dienelactone hydrolase [Periconia macrospinosa]|uniref:Dienelactone hydrolase n=1 Tax=Periconia macrospinosa TaxID=97972 RepID=A0A2V1DP98_9PLEO|nr:dienelactone hydrolase [Periconia macrospinosa]